MKSTRERILDYLELKQISTSTELSRLLQVTSADIRHHLNLLHKEGLIQIIGEKQHKGPGRPAKLYRLSQKPKQANLLILIEALLQVLASGYTPGDRSDPMQQVGEYISGSINSGGTLSQRLFHAINRLNELNYQARWEAHQQSPRIILGNCPYNTIVDNHPEICQVDRYLLESLLNLPVEQNSKLIRDDRKFTFCSFTVGDHPPR
jgi:predicted ArsR family transcriptional regulator